MESLRDEIRDKKITLDSLQAQNFALQANIRARQKCCFRSSAAIPIPARPRVPPADKGRGKGRGKGKGGTVGLSAFPTGSDTPRTTTESDVAPSDRTDDVDMWNRTGDASSSQTVEEKVLWKSANVFFVCRVGEET